MTHEDQQQTPPMLATSSTLGVVLTWDLGSGLPESESLLGKQFTLWSRDPRFYDPGVLRPIYIVRDTQLDLQPVEGSDDAALIRAYDLVRDATFSIKTYVHQLGFGALFLTCEISDTTDTDDLLSVANLLADSAGRFVSPNGSDWSLDDELDRTTRELMDIFTPPSSPRRSLYTMIHIHALDQASLEWGLQGESVYEQYKREMHALSVRIIRDWRLRYPAGSALHDQNAAVAPTGVIRFNARNVLLFEYPFKTLDVTALYYPALVELRIWQLMASVELSSVQAISHRVEAERFDSEAKLQLAASRRAALRMAGEFEALSSCSSKRTLSFYKAGTEEFRLGEIVSSVRSRFKQIEGVLSSLDVANQIQQERDMVNDQRRMAVNTELAANRSARMTNVVQLLGLSVTVQVSIEAATFFKWPVATTILFAAMFLASAFLISEFGFRMRDRHQTRVQVCETEILSESTLAQIYQRLTSAHGQYNAKRVEFINDEELHFQLERSRRSGGGRVSGTIRGSSSTRRGPGYRIRVETMTLHRRGCDNTLGQVDVDADLIRLMTG